MKNSQSQKKKTNPSNLSFHSIFVSNFTRFYKEKEKRRRFSRYCNENRYGFREKKRKNLSKFRKK